MKLAHPFMPFITEEIYHQLKDREDGDCIMVASWPKVEQYDVSLIKKVEKIFDVVTNVRNIRQQKQISPKEKLHI